MLRCKMDGTCLVCDKCGRTTRYGIDITKEARKKYEKKKIFCGQCIQERIHRSDPDYDFHKEFSFSWKCADQVNAYLRSIGFITPIF